MTSITTEPDHPPESERQFVKELRSYLAHLEAAFDELHEATVRHAKISGQYIGPHHSYPTMSASLNGFPYFSQSGFYNNNSPRDYVGSFRPLGLASILVKDRPAPETLPRSKDLIRFLEAHNIGKRFSNNKNTESRKIDNWQIDSLVNSAVERYLHLYGIDASVDQRRRLSVLEPLIWGTVQDNLRLRLVVPISLTHFEIDHFKLSEKTYITRIPTKLQLARARLKSFGSGAVDDVVGAATHAFVSKGWNLNVVSIPEIKISLSQASANVVDEVDGFFGAFRVATGVRAGYAQLLWYPEKWTLDYFCDLTPIYGTNIRRYPSDYDNYGWAKPAPRVTIKQLLEVRRVYGSVVASSSEAIRLALRRLNACLTRTDAADAILDATIGLELLLGDDDNQSLSYKLRLRAGALARLKGDPAYRAHEIAAKVKKLYEVRSSIVHGRRRKTSRKATESADTGLDEDRAKASDLLRFILDVLLTHTSYQEPSKIDEGLLLQSTKVLAPE